MKITATTVSRKETELKNITEICLTETAGVPCNSLSIKLKGMAAGEEISQIRVYEKDRLIFNGYCDTQKVSKNSKSFETYIYARSSACVLVDNEAYPYTFNCPCAKQLCLNYTEDLGFKCSLPEIYISDKYEVAKGTSCYGAVNNFVYLITGLPIYVSPENEIKILEKSGKAKSLDNMKIISVCSSVNRSEPLSVINYKRQYASDYSLHTESRLGKELEIKRGKYLNLLVLPSWQRDYSVLNRLKKSFEDYKTLEIVTEGFFDGGLFDVFSYSSDIGNFENYLLYEKKYTLDKRGARTKILLKQQTDIKEITYVD